MLFTNSMISECNMTLSNVAKNIRSNVKWDLDQIYSLIYNGLSTSEMKDFYFTFYIVNLHWFFLSPKKWYLKFLGVCARRTLLLTCIEESTLSMALNTVWHAWVPRELNSCCFLSIHPWLLLLLGEHSVHISLKHGLSGLCTMWVLLSTTLRASFMQWTLLDSPVCPGSQHSA